MLVKRDTVGNCIHCLFVQDPCYQVRLHFAQKLHKGLISLRLPLQFMSILALAATDPLKERRQQVKANLISNIHKRREYLKTNAAANGKSSQRLWSNPLIKTLHFEGILPKEPFLPCVSLLFIFSQDLLLSASLCPVVCNPLVMMVLFIFRQDLLLTASLCPVICNPLVMMVLFIFSQDCCDG